MSYTSLFEEAARNTAAISLLNKFRHVLQGRNGITLDTKEKNAIKEALTINEPRHLNLAIIYSLQGGGNELKGSVPSLGRAIEKALEKNASDKKQLFELINDSIAGNIPSPEQKAKTISFIETVMEIIGERDRESVKRNPLSTEGGNF